MKKIALLMTLMVFTPLTTIGQKKLDKAPKKPYEFSLVNDLTREQIDVLLDTTPVFSSYSTRWRLGDPNMIFDKGGLEKPERGDFILLTLRDLGFYGGGFDHDAVNWPTYEQILRIASIKGYKPCPAWVGPKLLLSKVLHPETFTIVATHIMTDDGGGNVWNIYDNSIDVFKVCRPWRDGTWYFEGEKFALELSGGSKYYFVFMKI